MPRQKKKTNYNPEDTMCQLMDEVSGLYLSAEGEGSHSIREIADEFGMTPLKIRKILITAGAFSSETCDRVLQLKKMGKSISEIQELTGLGRASVHSYLPYTKNIYNAEEMSQNAERIRVYRRRKAAIDSLREGIRAKEDISILEGKLWEAVKAFEKYPFYTMKGLRFTYVLKGRELFDSRKEKSITGSTVMLAFRKALELQQKVKGPKQLETFGASYLYPVFLRVGVIEV